MNIMDYSNLDPTVTHPEYPTLDAKYDLALDAFNGDVTDYIERLQGQTNEQYAAYQNRAAYVNIVEKSTSTIVGAMTRKPYKLTGIPTFPNNDYGSGDVFLQANFRDVLLGARVSILVDVGADGKSVLCSYDAEDIINWYGDGTNPGDFRMIEECNWVRDPENPYAQVEVTTWRELYIDGTMIDDVTPGPLYGTYQARVWTKGNNSKFTAVQMPTMLAKGKPLTFIPLFVATPFDNSWDVYNPPLYTQASLNIKHFQQSADLSHYAHYMALPTFTIVGDVANYDNGDGTTSTAKIAMGSTTMALHLTTGSSASYVEVSGTSASFLQAELANIEERMFITGANLLTTKNGVESAAALELRAGSEGGMLETITNSMQSAVNAALAVCAQVDGGAQGVIELNSDFTAAILSPQEITALLQSLLAGAITQDQFLQELYEGEVVRPPGADPLQGE